MKTKNMSILVTLNSTAIILAAFTLVQAYNYIRDAILLETGAFADFASSFASYMGTRVMPVLLIFAALIFFRAHIIQKVLLRLEAGEAVESDEIRKTKSRIRNFRNLILGVNLLGFGIGYVLDLILMKNIGVALELNRLMQLFFNLSSAAVYALAQIAINNIIFAGPRELLKIESMEGEKKEQGIRQRGLITTLFIAAYSMLFFYTNHAFTLQQEALYAESLEQGFKENLSTEQVEEFYKAETSRLLATKSSRLQLSPDQIVFPMDRHTSDARFDTARNTFIILFFMVITVVFGVQFASSSETRNQLQRIIRKMQDILDGDGDLTQRIPITQFDEIGDLSHHINEFILKLNALLTQVADVSSQVSQSSMNMHDSLEQASASVEEMLASAKQVKQNTGRQQDLAEDAQRHFGKLFEAIGSITENVESQATFIEETSSSIEEMAANIRSVSDAADRADLKAGGLESVAHDGEKSVENTIASIQEIEDASKRVSQIVGMIQDLNEQTNLLAMNAAIEAAHAGQEGKGFAVVANEVKKLAQDGTEQAKHIINYIDTMIDRISHGVRLSLQANSALNRISEDTKATSGIVQEISAAMKEQSSGAVQIVSAVESVVEATHNIRQEAIDQDGLSKQLQELIEHLVAVSTEIDNAAEEQIAGDSDVVKAVQAIHDHAESNLSSINILNQAISRFKLS
ncbi:MAG: methyl-accepting chemotaxis protein [Spirochaetales bacterium]|jgi:methyl-accepting chemotaxis protein|nr:methyl-accepting chemotaxis protein [Spirochaetales bacterium]